MTIELILFICCYCHFCCCCCFPSCLNIVRLCWVSQIPSEDRPETVPCEWLLSSTPAYSPFQWCLHPWIYLDWPLSWYWTKLHWMVDSHKFKDQLFTDILRAQCMTRVSSWQKDFLQVLRSQHQTAIELEGTCIQFTLY